MRDFAERPRTPAPDPRREQAAAFAKRKDALRRAIRSDADLTFAEKHIGLRLVDLIHAEHQVAWPSAPTLAADVGCSARTVWSAIKKLSGRHFDRELSGPGRHNVYRPRWPDEQEHAEDPVKHASCPREADFTPPVKHASCEIVNLDPKSKPESEDQCGFEEEGQSVDVTVEDHSAPVEEAEPSAKDARRGSETDITAEPDPDKPSLVAQVRAMGKVKGHVTDLTVDGLVQDFVKARKRQRRMGRDPGPVDIGFERYVRKAIKAHCGENREARLRRMEEVFGLDPARRPVRSASRAALDARIAQMGGRSDTCPA